MNTLSPPNEESCLKKQNQNSPDCGYDSARLPPQALRRWTWDCFKFQASMGPRVRSHLKKPQRAGGPTPCLRALAVNAEDLGSGLAPTWVPEVPTPFSGLHRHFVCAMHRNTCSCDTLTCNIKDFKNQNKATAVTHHSLHASVETSSGELSP